MGSRSPIKVGDRDVGRGQLFNVAVFATHVCDLRGVAARSAIEVAAALADRLVRVVANLATGDIRHLLVEQGGERAQDAALGLPAQDRAG